MGWSDYWTKLTAGFIAGTEPDVFANHISRFAQFVNLGVLQPLDELPEFQNFNEDQYQPNLAKNWVGQDGHRYGTPKDWDTVALFYNKKMPADAGYTPEDLANAAWNPTDGGSFEKILARLSIDEAGVRGDEPGFNPKSVKTYGLATNDAGSFDGQTQWSPFAASNGWTYTDVSPWGRHYNYDQPAFQDTMSWYFGLATKGYFAPFTVFSDSNGPDQQLGSGSAALSMNGSWMASTYYGLQGIEVGVAPTPSGPIGHPMTMQNGLADSITTNAHNKAGAAKWVAYLASSECQQKVGEAGVVFPADKTGTAKAIEAFRAKGIEVDAFTRPVDQGTTFSFPITDYTADVNALMTPAMQDVYANGTPASSLTRTNKQINLLFRQE